MGSRSSCRGCWSRGCRLMSCLRCSTCLPHQDVVAAPSVANAPAPPPVANALKQLPEITLEQLEQIIPLIELEVDRLDPASSSSSSQAPISQRLGDMLAQWEEQKQNCTSLINSLPKDLTNQVAGNGRSLLMPLLTDALHGMGGVRWLGVGFTFIAWSLDNINNLIQNREDCIGILRRSLRLLRHTKEIWQSTNYTTRIDDLQDSVEKAFSCAIFCTSNLTDGWILRFWKATNVTDAIAMLAVELDRANIQNIEFMVRQNLKREATKLESQITLHIHDDIAGGRDVMDDAVTFLQTSSDEIKAVLLHGMGGIGKSFLGMTIFTKFQNTYRACRVELQLETKKWDLCAIQKQILEKVCKRAASVFSNLVDGREHLEKELKQISDPFFLYVDNVLEIEFLTELLPKAACFPKGSRILITSRGEYIKPDILDLGIRDYNYKPIEVTKLQEQHAQELLWEQLKSKGEHRVIAEVNESLEKRVLALCEGLPLALVVVGKYIANGNGLENVEVWREVVESMEKAEALDGSANDKLYSRIKFSIDNLAQNVKRAFLDMIFVLDKDRYGRADWERVERMISPRCLKVLCQRALVRKREINSKAEIHDVLKALARRMVADDKHELRIKGMDKFNEHNDSASLKKVVALIDVTVNAYQLKQMPRLRLLYNVDVEGDCQEIQVRDLRVVERLSCSTARVFDWSKLIALKEITWERFEGAAPNVSNLAEVFKRDQISNMGLEALALLGWIQLKDVDVIKTLTCLKELRLQDCGAIESLPEEISRLTGLKQLDLYECKKLKGLPQGISSLTCLELLDLSCCEKLKCLPQGISNLTCLKQLRLRCCTSVQSLPDGLTSLTRLTELDLHGCESLQSIPEGIGNLRGVTHFDLKYCKSLQSIPEGATSFMNGLTELSLDRCCRIEYLPQGISRLTGLKKLSLEACVSLQSLPEGLTHIGLTSLNLISCRSLRALPEGIASLIKLDLRWCKALQSHDGQLPRLTGLTDLRLAACSSLVQDIPEKLGFMSRSLRQLQLSFLQMQSLPDEISELTGLVLLDLSSCKSLQSIKGVTTLTALIALKVDDCTELQFLPDGLSSLTSLRYIGLRGCRSLESIPEELGRIPGLHRLPVENNIKYGSGFYLNEKRLDLFNCESLKSLPQSIESFTLLEELFLQNCRSLKSLPEAVTRLSNLAELSLLGCRSLESLSSGLIRSFTGLTELRIGDCSAMLIQPVLEEVSWSSMRRLEVLMLSKCEDLRSLPTGITTLTSLRELSLSGCRNFKWLPQEMANWRGCLTRLDLSGCESLQSLPEELTTMTAILELDLSGCACLRSLPQRIFTSLADLKRLSISGCSGGLQLEEYEEIRRLTGLESLALWECEPLLLEQGLAVGLITCKRLGFKSLLQISLPEGLASVEELEELDLSGCESLQSLSNLPQGSVTCLQRLDLTGCGGLDQPSVWEMIVSFKSLLTLDLSGWESMQALPDQIASLTNLEWLSLSKCSSLLSLPESVSKLTNLNWLSLADCKSLRSLPPGITCLVTLEGLDLSGCTSLDQPLPEAFSAWISCIPCYES